MPCRRAPLFLFLGFASIVTLVQLPISAQGRAKHSHTPPIPGALRGEQAATALRARAAASEPDPVAGDPEALIGVMEEDPSAWVTPEGVMFFADVIHHDEPVPIPGPPSENPVVPGPPPVPSDITPAGLPIHHSKPGATLTIYLHLTGGLYTSRSWGMTRTLRPFTIDGDTATFNEQEQAVISRLWGRVAEDFALFNVNVTTQQPDGLVTPDRNVLWAIITTNSTAGFGSNIAGVSLFNCGYVGFGINTATFTFFNAYAPGDHGAIADTASQEIGHMFGLLHDGAVFELGSMEYYTGHGSGPTSWGPIMGAPFNRNVTQWSKGDYANFALGPQYNTGCGITQQDDIQIIAGRLGYRADDVTDNLADAPALTLPATGYVNAKLDAAGALATDVDVFALPPTRGVELSIAGFRAGELTDGGNLDVAADILDANGAVIASSDDLELTTASLELPLPPGAHYLRVRPSNNPENYPLYGSLGQYTITGAFANVAPSFTPGGVVSVMPSSGPFSQVWATDVSAGPPYESGQHLAFELTALSNPALFSAPLSLDVSGRLTFTPAPGLTGTAQVTVVLRDDGGTALGGEDASAPVTLRIDVRHQFAGFQSPLPRASLIAGRTIPVKFALVDINGRMSDASSLAIATRVDVWASAADAVLAAPASSALAEQACTYSSADGFYQCDTKLPRTLEAGRTYWIVAKYQDLDGSWVAPIQAGAPGANPVAFIAR